MRIKHFVASIVDKVYEFEGWWLERHREEPDIYPRELDLEEWQEQFDCWLEMYG